MYVLQLAKAEQLSITTEPAKELVKGRWKGCVHSMWDPFKFTIKAIQLQPKTKRTMCVEAEDSKPGQFRAETQTELGLDFMSSITITMRET